VASRQSDFGLCRAVRAELVGHQYFGRALSRPRFLLVNRARRPSAQMSKINNLRVR
jgi:hypothetical protein